MKIYKTVRPKSGRGRLWKEVVDRASTGKNLVFEHVVQSLREVVAHGRVGRYKLPKSGAAQGAIHKFRWGKWDY